MKEYSCYKMTRRMKKGVREEAEELEDDNDDDNFYSTSSHFCFFTHSLFLFTSHQHHLYRRNIPSVLRVSYTIVRLRWDDTQAVTEPKPTYSSPIDNLLSTHSSARRLHNLSFLQLLVSSIPYQLRILASLYLSCYFLFNSSTHPEKNIVGFRKKVNPHQISSPRGTTGDLCVFLKRISIQDFDMNIIDSMQKKLY